MASTPALAAFSAMAAARTVDAAPTCMMFVTLPPDWSAEISASLPFSSSVRRMLSPVPPAIQKPCTPAWMLNSITSRYADSFRRPASVIGVTMAGYRPRKSAMPRLAFSSY